jgi:hypothetical protein
MRADVENGIRSLRVALVEIICCTVHKRAVRKNQAHQAIRLRLHQ